MDVQPVKVTVEQDYITVDTQEWMDSLMVRDEHLTESLRAWLDSSPDEYPQHTRDYSGQYYPYTERIVRWAGVRFRADKRLEQQCEWWEMCTGLYGDSAPFEMFTHNEGDTLLSDEIGAVWFFAPDGSLLFVQTTSGAYGSYEWPTVYRVEAEQECLVDYRRADGGCVNGHSWQTEDGGIDMVDESFSNSHRIDECIRQIGDRYYIACPICRKAVHLYTSAY